MSGQSVENEPVYRFSVQGIADPTTAKPLQHALMEHAAVSACVFIDECDCFKLSVIAPIDHALLSGLLAANGHVLIGDVLVSDGTVLRPSDHIPDPR